MAVKFPKDKTILKSKTNIDPTVLTVRMLERLIWLFRRSRWVKNLLVVLKVKTLLLEVRYLQRSGPNYTELEDGKGSLSSSYPVRRSDSLGARHEVKAPIGMWKVLNSDIYFFPKFPFIRAKGSLVLLPRNEAGPYNLYPKATSAHGFQVLRQEADVVLAQIPTKTISVEACTYVGTRSPTNWSHWFINFLPGVMVASDFYGRQPAPPLIVGPGFRDGEARSSLFDYFWPDDNILFCDDDDVVRSGSIYWFEQPYSDSPRSAKRENLKPKFANLSIMTEFRRRLLEFGEASHTDGEFPEKIFLARENTMSRPYNQEEVHAVARDSGYEVIFLNRLPIAQQIALIAKADRVIGPTGSAFASTIVAKRGAKLLEISTIPKKDKVEDWYAPLAQIAGANFFITFDPLRYEQESGRACFDIETVARCFSSL